MFTVRVRVRLERVPPSAGAVPAERTAAATATPAVAVAQAAATATVAAAAALAAVAANAPTSAVQWRRSTGRLSQSARFFGAQFRWLQMCLCVCFIDCKTETLFEARISRVSNNKLKNIKAQFSLNGFAIWKSVYVFVCVCFVRIPLVWQIIARPCSSLMQALRQCVAVVLTHIVPI